MNCVWALCVVTLGNARIDIPCNGAHDRVWCSPFASVLAIDLLPKRQRPYRSLTSVGRGLFRHRMGERRLEATLMRSHRRTIDDAFDESARRPDGEVAH